MSKATRNYALFLAKRLRKVGYVETMMTDHHTI